MVIQDRDGRIPKPQSLPDERFSFRTEIPDIEPERLSHVIDRLLVFALDTLGAQHIDLRVVSPESGDCARSEAA